MSESFAEWYEAEHPVVLAVVAASFGNRDLALDATSEAFARAWEKWGRVSSMERPTAWTVRVAMNEAKRQLRRASVEWLRARRVNTETRPTDVDLPDWSVWAAVGDLPERQRLAVALRHIGDLTEPEIARIIGVSRGTVSSTLRAAHASLRTDLGEHGMGSRSGQEEVHG